ncbi:uncharacterized protein AMSG_00330 [Thecamonas trahens ATCC 50062]|uniref:SnoaL-like domain-containing protein n=1 Tax=Thecamonas trahens ATCC 50062 TaxID=461836 RepID=A0A0L0D883_THETB|nr:hypothetical protein AMSG_00330 [Thecamonas trahens ATCC 50062]KNC48554.1 hypothetical protein AMSG_00330 [Thecamonas trahens ATCC 50062]|eukprot:XP_013762611.1 hypothetical protein AMSG_00330 [Thecamonas trahens ATCC 50062]
MRMSTMACVVAMVGAVAMVMMAGEMQVAGEHVVGAGGFGPMAGGAAPQGVYDVVLAYRDRLNTDDCKGWAALFTVDGIKYDAPAPAIGRAALEQFCVSHRSSLLAFQYAYASPIMVTESSGFRATVQWLIGGATAPGKGMVQTGFGSYVLTANATAEHGFLIAECTGYNLDPFYE